MAIVFPNNTIREVSSSFVSYPGNIVQIVESKITATLSVNNWNTANTIGSLTITPTSTSSTILLYIHMNMRMDTTAGGGAWSLCYVDLYNSARGQLIISGWDGTQRNTIYSYRKQYLDSPGSTAAQTYSLRCYNFPSGVVGNFNTTTASDGICYIRATEYAA